MLITDFLTLFLGLIIEAFPFVVLGVCISVAVALFVKEETFIKLLPKNRILSHLMISLFGAFMPVCECGNLPVARRFAAQGLSVSHSIAFLFAAPIVNPITAWSTYEAFNRDIGMVVLRLGGALIIANIIALIISLHTKQKELLTDSFVEYCELEDGEHNHGKLDRAFSIFSRELFTVTAMLVVGGLIAALFQTVVPRSVILSLGNNPILSVFTMMLLAFVISICANVDAFFAASFASTFSAGSLLAFMVFGPMIDIKMLALMRTTYKAKPLIIIVLITGLLSYILGIAVNLLL